MIRRAFGERSGQGVAVHLAAGRVRHRRQQHERGRDHVFGQPFPHVPPKPLRGRQPRPGSRRYVSDQPLRAFLLAMQDHGRLMHRRMRRQDGLDFADFNAIAAQLDLLIEPAQKLQIAVRQPATAIPRAVQSRTEARAERIGYEPLGRQLRIIHIPARQTRAANVEFARHADRNRPLILVQHIHLNIGDGPADGDDGAFLAATAGPPGRIDGHFRRTIQIVQFHIQQLEQSARQVGRHRLAAAVDPAQRAPRLARALIQHKPQQTRRNRQDRHGIPTDAFQDQRGIAFLARRGENQLGTGDQRGEDNRYRGIKHVRDQQKQTVVRTYPQIVLVPEDGIADGPMLDHHSLGTSGRSGSVDDVSEIVWRGERPTSAGCSRPKQPADAARSPASG